MKYFVCFRERHMLDKDYAKEFLKDYTHTIMHDAKVAAEIELRSNFYDDCDYEVMAIDESGNITFAREERERLYNEYYMDR